MYRDKNIEKLFRESLHDLEAKPSPEVWNAVSKVIPSGAQGISQNPGHPAFNSGMLLKGIIGLITAGLITTGILFFNREQIVKTAPQKNVQVKAQSLTPVTAPGTVKSESAFQDAPVEVPEVDADMSLKPETEQKTHQVRSPTQIPDKIVPKPHLDVQNVNPAAVDEAKAGNGDADEYRQTASTDPGDEQAIVQTLIVERQTKPAAIISASPVRGFAPLEVQLENEGYAVENRWIFEDDAEASGLLCTHTFNSDGEHTVVLKAKSEDGNFAYDTVKITVFGNTAPSAEKSSLRKVDLMFTPNGDGNADYLEFGGVNLVEMKVLIFDRSGRAVAQSNGAISFSWNGTMKDGSQAPEGTYFYVIRAKGMDGNLYEQKGYSTILR